MLKIAFKWHALLMSIQLIFLLNLLCIPIGNTLLYDGSLSLPHYFFSMKPLDGLYTNCKFTNQLLQFGIKLCMAVYKHNT